MSSEDESVVEEGRSVEEDGLRFEEEFGKEGEVLAVELSTITSAIESKRHRVKVPYLELLAIDLMDDIFVLLINDLSVWCFRFHGTDFLPQSAHHPSPSPQPLPHSHNAH